VTLVRVTNHVTRHPRCTRIDQPSIHYHLEKRQLTQLTYTSQLWGFKSEGRCLPDAYAVQLTGVLVPAPVRRDNVPISDQQA
jgi:hypothetical protein